MPRATILLVLLAAGAGAAGCGSSGDANDASATPTAAALLTSTTGAPVPVPKWAVAAADVLLPVQAFAAPEAAYRHYAAAKLAPVSAGMHLLTKALAGNHRRAGRAAWRATWTAYLHVGLSYGTPQGLDQAIDGTPPNGQTFQGLHLIEQALWQDGDLRSMAPVATQLQGDVAQLRATVPHLNVTALQYTLRPHELLDDAQRHLLSGDAVPWSQYGVAGAAAELAAAEAIVGTLAPLLSERGATLTQVAAALKRVQTALLAVRHAHHGHWPPLAALRPAQRARIDAAVSAAVLALQTLPQALPSTPPEAAPR